MVSVPVDDLDQRKIPLAVSRGALVRGRPAAGHGEDVVVGTLGEAEPSLLDGERLLVNGHRLQRSEGAAEVAYVEAQLVLLLQEEPQRVSARCVWMTEPRPIFLEVDRPASRCVQTDGEPEQRAVLKGGAVNLCMLRSVQLGTVSRGNGGNEVCSDSLSDT